MKSTTLIVEQHERVFAKEAQQITEVPPITQRAYTAAGVLKYKGRNAEGTGRAIYSVAACAELRAVHLLAKVKPTLIQAATLSRCVVPTLASRIPDLAGAYRSSDIALPKLPPDAWIDNAHSPAPFKEIYLQGVDAVSKSIEGCTESKRYAFWLPERTIAMWTSDRSLATDIAMDGAGIVFDIDAVAIGMVRRAPRGFFQVRADG